MPDARIGDNVTIDKAIIGSRAVIRKESRIGNGETVTVVADKEEVKSGTVIE